MIIYDTSVKLLNSGDPECKILFRELIKSLWGAGPNSFRLICERIEEGWKYVYLIRDNVYYSNSKIYFEDDFERNNQIICFCDELIKK